MAVGTSRGLSLGLGRGGEAADSSGASDKRFPPPPALFRLRAASGCPLCARPPLRGEERGLSQEISSRDVG